MALEAGRSLAHYEILEPIGKGGMGEVYRALDSKLGREVAIKVLPDELAEDDERLKRFEREAKVLAALNHPNIAAIYGLEQSGNTHYLVLELVEGETLAERIAGGPLPIDEAIAIATKIARALEDAHEQGIVHRDLKPANVKLTPDDDVKVLDFGLAKTFVDEAPDVDSSVSPTLTRDSTRVGVILGTAAYMSPEQAKGKKVDKRTDIFAFGSVLFEMLTGKKAFPGDDVSEILASVIKLEPDWNALPNDVPDSTLRLLRSCLNKNARERLRDIGGAFFALESPSSPVLERPATRFGLRWAALGALAGFLVAASVAWIARPSTALAPVSRFSIAFPEGQRLGRDFALSPDGRTLVYSAFEDGELGLYRRSLDGIDPVAIDGGEGGGVPFFSPDGGWVGFATSGEVRKVPLSGGSPVTILQSSAVFQGGAWTSTNELIVSSISTPLRIVSADGGVAEPLTALATGELNHAAPVLIDEERALLMEVVMLTESYVAVVRRGEREHVVLTEGSRPRLVAPNWLVFERDRTLWGARFDETRLEIAGEPAPLGEGARFVVAPDGALIYSKDGVLDSRQELVWVDRAGEREAFAAAGLFRYPRVSPDGLSVVVNIGSDSGDLWLYDIERARRTRLTTIGDSNHPTWTPDGERVVFAGRQAGDTSYDLLSQSVTGGDIGIVYSNDGVQTPTGWSPDGEFLSFIHEPAGRALDIWLLREGGDAEVLLGSAFAEQALRFSPDGQWIAYVSNESGRAEVYVQAFPELGRKYPISTNGGTEPVWARDGRELFYRQGERMMAVSVRTEPSFDAADPAVLFEGPYSPGGISGNANYDVSPDGERFLMVEPSGGGGGGLSELYVVTNWAQQLERLLSDSN